MKTSKCVLDTSPKPATCKGTDTHCEIVECADGYIDANGILADGCEYQCTPQKRVDPNDPTKGLEACTLGTTGCGIEYCDGIDNDCNGLIDAADPNLANPSKGDPEYGQECYGGSIGECGAPHAQGRQALRECDDPLQERHLDPGVHRWTPPAPMRTRPDPTASTAPPLPERCAGPR